MTITKSTGNSLARRLINWLNEPASDRFEKTSRILYYIAPPAAALLSVAIASLAHAHH